MVTRTNVDLCNDALFALDEEVSISNLDGDDTNSQRCARFLPRVRRTILSDFHFGFATVYKPLTPSTEVIDGWEYSYIYPSNCLDLISINNSVEYAIMSGSGNTQLIVTRAKQSKANYVIDMDNPKVYSDPFWNYMVAALAYKMAGLYQKPKEKVQALMMELELAKTSAQKHNIDQQQYRIKECPYIAARGS